MLHPPTSERLAFRDLGRIRYADALALQRETHARTVAAREGAPEPMTVYLLEHDPPVITVSRRPGAAAHLLATPEALARAGVEVEETDRGGDITYHGPGQLVVYPIVDLNRLGLRIHGYMRLLEQVVIDAVAAFGVVGRRDEGATGVWVGGEEGAGGRKLCAMGVRVSRWVAMHGFALNVAPNLAHFGLIVPCGLVGRPVTSLAAELGDRQPSMDEVKRVVAETLVAAVG